MIRSFDPDLTCPALPLDAGLAARGLRALAAGIASLLVASTASAEPTRVVGYYPSWGIYDRGFEIANLPGDKLSHVNYAFANLVGGQCVLGDPWADVERHLPGDPWTGPGSDAPYFGNFKQLDLLQEAHPGLQTLISVGGWTWSGNFSDAALTPASRALFAASCADFMEAYGFDGIDIDWEYPGGGGLASNTSRPEDTENFTLLLQALRSELDARGAAKGRHYALTIAAPAGAGKIANIQVEQIHPLLDFINVMTYDFNGNFSPVSNFNAPLYASSGDPTSVPGANTDAALQTYLARGVPPDKLVMGIPFYGRAVTGAANSNGGLFQSFTGTPMGTWDTGSTGATGMFDYADLAAHYLGQPGIESYRDAEAGVPWLYAPASGLFISYDDPTSLGLKRDYVDAHQLGGVMIWEMSSDLDGQLLNALLGAPTPATVPTLAPVALALLTALLGYTATRSRFLSGEPSSGQPPG